MRVCVSREASCETAHLSLRCSHLHQVAKSHELAHSYSQVWINKIFQRKLVNIFIPISFNICFGCSKEPSHWGGSFEYPQHNFGWERRKLNFHYKLLTKVLLFDQPIFSTFSIIIHSSYFPLVCLCWWFSPNQLFFSHARVFFLIWTSTMGITEDKVSCSKTHQSASSEARPGLIPQFWPNLSSCTSLG